MKRLLHIIATPRGASSRTLKVSRSFLGDIKRKHPGCIIDEIELFEEILPELSVKRLDGKYALLGGGGLTVEMEKAWQGMIAHIDRFLGADTYLITTPMWNFGVPYRLKHYIDVIFQPKYLFRYTKDGVEGLAKNKKMVVVTSRGGDYSASGPMRSYDYLEPYLKAAFGFVGITDITFINAQPMDALGPKVQEEKIKEAQSRAREVAEKL